MGGRLYEIVGVGPESFTGIDAAESWYRHWTRPRKAPHDFSSVRGREGQGVHRHQEGADGPIHQPDLIVGAGGRGRLGNATGIPPFAGGARCIGGARAAHCVRQRREPDDAQAAARAREMALRVAIGAGRWRLVQLVLVESAWLAFLAAVIGAWFAWRSARKPATSYAV
jgi:FtsX-like permease family